MGRYVAVVFVLALTPFYSDAVIRHPSITKSISMYVDVNITNAQRSPIDVKIYNPNARLVWNADDTSFHRVDFNYVVEVDGFQNGSPSVPTLHETTYRVVLRDIALACSSKTDQKHYSGIHSSRENAFGNVSVRWGNGTESSFNWVGMSLVSPAGLFQLVDNDVLGRKIAVSEGAISVQFPKLRNETLAGGAVCRGGALFLFASVL